MSCRPDQIKNLTCGHGGINPELLPPDFIREVPAGVMDGVNRSFTLQYAVSSELARVFINGHLQQQLVHYTINNRVLSLNEPLVVGDVLEVLRPPAGGISIDQRIAEDAAIAEAARIVAAAEAARIAAEREAARIAAEKAALAKAAADKLAAEQAAVEAARQAELARQEAARAAAAKAEADRIAAQRAAEQAAAQRAAEQAAAAQRAAEQAARTACLSKKAPLLAQQKQLIADIAKYEAIVSKPGGSWGISTLNSKRVTLNKVEIALSQLAC